MQSPSRSAPADAEVDAVLVALMTVGRLMRRRDGDTVDPAIFWLLKTLAAAGPLRVTELAGSAELDTSTVSRHVAQMSRSGLVERTPDPDDGRAQRIALSSAGRNLLEESFQRRRALLSRVFSGWDPDDTAQLDRLLRRFVADIEHTTDLERS